MKIFEVRIYKWIASLQFSIDSMEAIYEALLLIESSPNKATSIINNMSYNNPNFLELLKDMCLQLRDRFGPQQQSTQLEFQSMSKRMLVIFNRMFKQAFLQQGNHAYCKIDDYYHWILEILACPSIAFVHKKVLDPSLSLIIRNMASPKQRFLEYLDHITKNNMKGAASVFVYLETIIKSDITPDQIVNIIKESYTSLYYICNYELNNTIDFYRQRYMEQDDPNPYSPFVLMLKQIEFMLSTLCQMVSFCFNYYNKNFNTHRDHGIQQMLFNQNLGQYLKRILNLERQLFSKGRQSNKYGLQIIIIDSLTAHECKTINNIKTMGLTTISLILSVTDKRFNLKHTNKVLLKNLSQLTLILISDLKICSQPFVLNELNQQNWSISMLSAMFDVLKNTCSFVDLQQIIHQLIDVKELIKLTFGFLKTYQQQLQVFQHQPEQFFSLSFYMIFGNIDELEDETLDLTLGDFCMKKYVVDFIRNMCLFSQGFTSTVLQLCLDVILLEISFRQTGNQELKTMFKVKYQFDNDLYFELINLQSSILVFTIVIQNFDNKAAKLSKIKQFLAITNTKLMTQLEIGRMYVCLSMHSDTFKNESVYTQHYHYIQKALSMNKKSTSVSKLAYYFLERITTRQFQKRRQYSIILDKILNDSLDYIVSTNSALFLQFLVRTVQNKDIRTHILQLEWINRLLNLTNMLTHKLFGEKKIHHQLSLAAIKLLIALVDASKHIFEVKERESYHHFKEEGDKFSLLINQTLHSKLVQSYNRMFKDKQLINQQYHCIFALGDFLFTLFIQDIRLTNDTFLVVIQLIMGIISRDEKESPSYKTIQFKLLYQLINRVPYDLQEEHYIKIRNWMELQLESEYVSDLYTSQVCIILQLIYFFIHGNIFQKANMIAFFQPITAHIEKIFIKKLLTYEQYCQMIQSQSDPNIRKIKLSNLHHNPYNKQQKKNPITIARLYNTIILNPNHQPHSIHMVKNLLKFYIRDQIPYYDLAVHFLAISILVSKSKNSGVLEIFTMGLDMLYCNAINQKQHKKLNKSQQSIKDLTKQLRSPITILDPYAELYNMVSAQLNKPRRPPIFIDYRLPFEQIEVNIIEFIRSDEATLNMVKKLVSIRRVNDQARKIVKIKRDVE